MVKVLGSYEINAFYSKFLAPMKSTRFTVYYTFAVKRWRLNADRLATPSRLGGNRKLLDFNKPFLSCHLYVLPALYLCFTENKTSLYTSNCIKEVKKKQNTRDSN